MAEWKQCFVLLLLPLTVCSDNNVILVKTIGSEPDVTPICSNETLSIITLIVCEIRTERSREEECRLLYRHGHGFENRCDSRFTLIQVNQTVFLHLTRLTPEDGGNYTCQCSQPGRTNILHLDITVEEDEDASSSTLTPILRASIGVTVVIVITGVFLGFICVGVRQRRQPRPQSSRPNTEPEDIAPYSTFIQRERGLYSTVRLQVSNTNTNNANMFTREDKHTGEFLWSSNYMIYSQEKCCPQGGTPLLCDNFCLSP